MEKETSKATPPFEIETSGVDSNFFKNIFFFFFGRTTEMFHFLLLPLFTLRRAVIWCVSSDFRHVTFSLTGHTTKPTPPHLASSVKFPSSGKLGNYVRVQKGEEKKRRGPHRGTHPKTVNKQEGEMKRENKRREVKEPTGRKRRKKKQATLQLFHRSCKTRFAFTMRQRANQN